MVVSTGTQLVIHLHFVQGFDTVYSFAHNILTIFHMIAHCDLLL